MDNLNASPPTVTTTQFKHEPLPDAANHIRLLEVLDDNYPETIKVRCRITTWPIDEAPSYHAISYTWGDPASNTIILINDETFKVRTNCEFVLKQACWHGQSHYYWIDAICIDQENLEEKSKQVAMMGNIYKTAEHVLACVGDHADDSLLLYQKLTRISDISTGLRPRMSNLLLILCWKYKTSTVRRFLHAAVQFAQRPYFTRLWILQELMNSKAATFLCGPDGVPKVDVRMLFLEISHYFSYPVLKPLPMVFSTLCALREWASPRKTYRPRVRWQSEKVRRTLNPYTVALDHASTDLLLFAVANFQCTYRRDKLYGIMSIIDWGDVAPPVPNYTKTDFQVISEFIKPMFDLEENQWGRSDPLEICKQLIWGGLGLGPETDGVSGELEARRFGSGSMPTSSKMQMGDSMRQVRSMANGWRISGEDLNKEHPEWSVWQPGVSHPMVYLPRWVEEGDWILELEAKLHMSKQLIVVREVAEGLGGPIVGRGWSARSESLGCSGIAFQVFWDPEDLLLFLLTLYGDFETPVEINDGVCKRQSPVSSYATRQICC